MRSSSGPDIRARYLAISGGAQRQRPEVSPRYPHGHGFMAATSWNRAGYSTWNEAREMETTPDSIGSRRLLSTRRLNFGISSRNKTTRCERLTSHGVTLV